MTCLEQFCDIQLPPEVDLCQAHENERESGLIDECPTCGVYKDVKYETCLQCKRSGKTAQTTPIPRYDPASTASTISDLAADQKAHERRAAMKSYLATVSAWIALATLWAADCLIQLMLRTRSNERTVRATKRVPWPKGLRQELMRRQGNRCVYCGCRLAVYNCEIDHMDPVIRGGSNDKDNLQVLCRPCNMRKGPQTDQEFRKRYARLVPVHTPDATLPTSASRYIQCRDAAYPPVLGPPALQKNPFHISPRENLLREPRQWWHHGGAQHCSAWHTWALRDGSFSCQRRFWVEALASAYGYGHALPV